MEQADNGYITAHSEDDWECLCGNTAMSDGFWPCLADGTEVEPTTEGPWDGRLVLCQHCGRIMDQSTFDGATWDQYNAASDPKPSTKGRVLVVRGPVPDLVAHTL